MNDVNEKLDVIVEKISRIDATLAVQAESLRDHIRRTEILENKIQPLEEWRFKFAGALALLSAIAIVASIAEVWLKFFR